MWAPLRLFRAWSVGAVEAVSGLPGELWRHRSLFVILLKREVDARTAGTVLGAVWLFLQPGLQILALWFLLDVVFRVRLGGQQPFQNYFLVGMVSWFMLADILQRSLVVLVDYGSIYQRNVFPVRLLPLLPILVSGVMNGAVLVLVVWLMEGIVAAAVAILLVMVLLLWTVPFSYLFSLLGLFVRDLRQFIPLGLTAIMYLTPILYLPDNLPASLRWLLPFNPFADLMALVHGVLQHGEWTVWNAIRPAALWLLVVGPVWRLFVRAEPQMRELL